MRSKKLHLIMLGVAGLVGNVANAQLFIDQATFTIQSGATVTVQGDVTSNTDIQGTGKIILKGTANQNVNVGGFNIPNLEVDNAANVTLTGNARVNGDLLFTNGNVLLGNNTLTIGNSGTITGATASKFVVTNGTGTLVKGNLGATAFNFPIGNSTTSYDPLSISNSGTADNIGARSINGTLAMGATGTAYTKETINNSWQVTEAVAGGSNLSITANWTNTDELPGFDRTRGGLSYYVTAPAGNVGWDLLNSQTGAAAGSSPSFSYTRTGITNTGVFAVGTRPVLSPLLVSPKVFLHGPYNTSTDVMNDALRTQNLIPLTEPYSTIAGGNMMNSSNAVRGSGGGETSTTAILGNGSPQSNNSIVDWVLVQLHDGTTSTVVTQRAALLQRDGDVVDVDGISPLNLAGNLPGNYFVSVKHRNHLGVRTAANIALAKTTAATYDFTDNLSKAFTGTVTTNNVMIRVNQASQPNAVYGMFSGNGNSNNTTQKTGSATTNDYSILLNSISTTPAYSRADYNMNGTVTRTGSATNNDYSKFINNFSGLIINIISVPAF